MTRAEDQVPPSAHDDATDVLRAKVLGMDCGSCAIAVEDGLKQLPGVRRVSVDFTTESLEIEGRVSRTDIEHRINQLGYRLAQSAEQPPAATASGLNGFVRYLLAQPRHRTALALAIVVLLTAGFSPLWPALDAVKAWIFGATVLIVGAPIFSKGLRALIFSRRIMIDLLMTLAALGALLIGQVGEAVAVVLLFDLGEALEGFSASRARDSLRSLIALQPQTATVLREHPGGSHHHSHDDAAHDHCSAGHDSHSHEMVVPAQELVPGDRLLVRPGERIAADGVIDKGESSINEAALTGESLPVARSVGDNVMAGTINAEGVLEILVTHRSADSTVARIARLVEQAQAQRSPAERFIDRFARWYTPAVVVLAFLIVAIPAGLFGQPLLAQPDGAQGWLYRGLTLLIVACPCALVISIPVTVVSSLTRLARLGVLVKGGERLDRLAEIRVIAFDKTGTLTHGRPSVTAIHNRGCAHETTASHGCVSCDDVIALAAAVESGSEHPIAHAILESARARGLRHRYPRATAVSAKAGRGIVGELDGHRIAVGSDVLMSEYGVELPEFAEALRSSNQTVMMVARDSEIVGAISVEDPIRNESGTVLEELRAAVPPVHTVLLTGDKEHVARNVAARVGVQEVFSDLLPEDKLDAVRVLQQKHGPVAMVGDGINDAPALARADVGIAMGSSGTAQAMETADIVLIQDDLRRIPAALRIARRNGGIVKQNIALSLGLKLAFLLLVIPGWATLWLAIVADVGATILVTLNGMRMLRAS